MMLNARKVEAAKGKEKSYKLSDGGGCSGQLILATRPDCSWNSRSDSFGVKPPLYQ